MMVLLQDALCPGLNVFNLRIGLTEDQTDRSLLYAHTTHLMWSSPLTLTLRLVLSIDFSPWRYLPPESIMHIMPTTFLLSQHCSFCTENERVENLKRHYLIFILYINEDVEEMMSGCEWQKQATNEKDGILMVPWLGFCSWSVAPYSRKPASVVDKISSAFTIIVAQFSPSRL